MSQTAELTFWDKAIGKVYAPYLTKAIQHRTAQQGFQNLSRRDDRGRKSSSGYTEQPYGYGRRRTLTPFARRAIVQQCRDLYENNALAHSLIERAVDNIIGEGMEVKPMTSDAGFNQAAKQWWDQYAADATGRFSKSEIQRIAVRSHHRDGDIGAIMLRRGQIQIVETDYIRSPNRSDDMFAPGRSPYEPEVVDGVRVGSGGRPQAFHVETADNSRGTRYPAISARDFIFYANLDRANYTAQRGTPLIAIIRPLLEHVDATNEAVVMAHRIAASFGALVKKDNPGQSSNALAPLNSSSSVPAGAVNKKFQIKPGMFEYLNPGESIEQIKPEHPTTSYAEFMSFQVRMAGIVLGLPLELALLDFSKTNYSSARASLEQSYRSFRVQQNRFKDQWLTKWYRWRISKAVGMGEFGSGVPDDFQRHTWHAQPWPYLNPVQDAQGVLAATDAGMTTLTDELAKRGYEFGEWLDMRREEIQRADEADVPLFHSNLSRDATETEQPDNANPIED